MAKKVKRKKGLINSLIEPLNWFYMGFLASVGLSAGSILISWAVINFVELAFGFHNLLFSIFLHLIISLVLFVHAYWFFEIKKSTSFRTGFILFLVIYILLQIYMWITNILNAFG